MKIDNDNMIVWVRQSWLNTLTICPERARYNITLPSWSRGSDATAIGTGMHTAIENYLNGQYTEFDDFNACAQEAVQEELAKPNVTRGGVDNDKIPSLVESMGHAFYDDIAPHVTMGGVTEHNFNIVSDWTVGPYRLGFSGTMDYVAPDGVIWDWKTAARSYYANEKQKQSIQASVYAYASGIEFPDIVSNGLSSLIQFKYGVMVRQEKPRGQVVSVTRSAGQIEWMFHQVTASVSAVLQRGTESAWIRNDQHNLCSAKWCDYWSICKGAYISQDDMFAPNQTIDKPSIE
jgi:hypothetical protein